MLKIMKIAAVAMLLRNDNENRDTRYQIRDTISGRRVTEIFFQYSGHFLRPVVECIKNRI